MSGDDPFQTLPDEIEKDRRLARKRYNEHVKLIATFLNTLSLAVIGTGLVIPVIGGGPITLRSVIWILVGFGLHFCAHVAIDYLASEE